MNAPDDATLTERDERKVIAEGATSGEELDEWGAPISEGRMGITTGPAQFIGRLTQWIPLDIRFVGPHATEMDDNPNPFLDYRLIIHFTGPSSQHYSVPGFFDGDGNGSGTGNVWRAHFVPDEPGQWSYFASFQAGDNVAVDLTAQPGTPTAFDGATGTFDVSPRILRAPGFYKWGKLEYVGDHYMKFRQGPYFIKGGTNSPENLLAYLGFDNTFDQSGGAPNDLPQGVHRYLPHVGDFGPGGLGSLSDPLFSSANSGYDSRGIIGALNYLASVGVNSIFFLPMNLGGDGRETAPFVSYQNTHFAKTHYDISKLWQWNAVFTHAQRKGIMLHIVLQETEVGNESYLDGGALGVERKLFFREMVARFGHALAIKWNLSEESNISSSNVQAFAEYIRSQDPYDHPIGFHTHLLTSSGNYAPYAAVLGNDRVSASSIQCQPYDAGWLTERWRNDSANAGHRWVTDMDEFASAEMGLTDSNADQLRKEALYDVYFSGGSVEWYMGYHPLPLGGDLSVENFRTREAMWNYMRYAREFMQKSLPFWRMDPADNLVTGESTAFGGAEVFRAHDEVYAVYYPSASNTGTINLSGTTGEFDKLWFNPREGLFEGPTERMVGGGSRAVGSPPASGSGSTAFQESGGLLVMEVESAPSGGGWASETQYTGYTGSSYYRWNGPDYFTTPGNGLIRYQFVVNNPGNYNLRMHNRHNHPMSDQENDCWIRLDGGPWVKLYSNQGGSSVGQWTWASRFHHANDTHEDAHYQLSAGLHTVEISGRSRNFMIDRMHLYLNSVTDPLNKNRPQSPLGPGGNGTQEDWVMLLKK